MAITYPLTLPSTSDLAPKDYALRLDYAQASNQSPFTLNEQIYDYQQARWRLEISYPPLTVAEAKIIKGFILALNGRVGTFKAGDPLNITPAGNPTGALVNGSSQVGTTLVCDGVAPNQTPAFAAGDDFTLNNCLYTVVQNANSDGSGNVTLEIQPPLVTSPANNAVLTTTAAFGLFRLESANTGWSAGTDRVYGISISAVQA